MINASNQWELCTLQGNEADSLPIPLGYTEYTCPNGIRFVVKKTELKADEIQVEGVSTPDYPLKWGQTSFTGIEENNEFSAFATLHPNPTSGLVTIMGENLKQAEACNMLGQQVLSVQGKAMNFTSTWLNCPQASISSPSPMRKVGNVYVR